MSSEQQPPQALSLEDWPDMLRRLAEVIGPELTLHLAATYGGLESVSIPREPTTSHFWRAVLGDEAWAKVVTAFGGERVSLPRGAFLNLRKRQILALAEEGLAHRQIAIRTRTTERYVRRVLEGLRFSKPEDERQTKLF